MKMDTPTSFKSNKNKMPRKLRKIIVEKKRRERIDGCLKQIKELLFQGTEFQVYILSVVWSDGTTFPIYRKYSELYELHVTLLDQFPTAAGLGGDRVLPFLPTKKMFGRNEVKKVAVERKMYLDGYCRTLLGLDPSISQDDTVLEFFEATHSDINPPKDATKRNSVSLISSLTLMMPKFLQRDKKGKEKSRQASDSMAFPDVDMEVSGPINFDTYYVIADYKASAKGEVSLEEGTEVDVIEKNENGWWLVSSGTDQGWAPASFLEPLNINQEIDEPEPLYNGETYVTLAEYKAELDDEINFPKGVIVEVLHKLLDGWWIISYNDNVGHAPATLLTECHNPHVLSANIPKTKKKIKRPTQRRCTIKNAHSKWTKKTQCLPEKDLTLYRRMSDRVSLRKKQKQIQSEGKALPPPPPSAIKRTKALPSLPPVIMENVNGNNEDSVYANDDDPAFAQGNSDENYLLQKRITQQEIEAIGYEYPDGQQNLEDDVYENVDDFGNNDTPQEAYINVESPVSPNNNSKTLPPVPHPRIQIPPKSNTLPVNNNNTKPQPLSPNSQNNNRPIPKKANKALLNALPDNRIPTAIAFVNNPKLSPKPAIKSKPKNTLETKLITPTKDRSPSPRLPRSNTNDVHNDVINNGAVDNGTNTAKGLLAQRIAKFNS